MLVNVARFGIFPLRENFCHVAASMLLRSSVVIVGSTMCDVGLPRQHATFVGPKDDDCAFRRTLESSMSTFDELDCAMYNRRFNARSWSRRTL